MSRLDWDRDRRWPGRPQRESVSARSTRPPSAAQERYLRDLAEQIGRDYPDPPTRRDAHVRIEQFQRILAAQERDT